MKQKTFEVNRDWNNEFCDFLRDCGFDSYGCIKDTSLKITIKKGKTDELEGFENDVFSVFPYYWGDDFELSDIPNFTYKPTGLQISWYKYPFRSSYMNQNISFSELEEILVHCSESLENNNGFPTKTEAIDVKIKEHKKAIKQHEQAIHKLQKDKEMYSNQ